MRIRVGLLAVAVLVVLAGCGSTADRSADTTVEAGGSPTSTDGSTATRTPLPSPWGTERIVVGVATAPQYADRNVTDEIRPALAYWENNPTWYAPEFVLRPNASDPDVLFSVRPRIEACHGEATNVTFYWCTRVFEAGDRARGTTTVAISGAYTDEGTTAIATAAVGNLMGVRSPAGTHTRNFSTLRYRDPWVASDPVVVGVNVTVDRSRAFARVVRRAVDYWERNDDRYAAYTAAFVVRPDAPDPDVEVRFVDAIPTCGIENRTGPILGCASPLDRTTLAGQTEVVRVVAGMTDESTYDTLRHELGHLYGLEHGDAPASVMAPTGNVTWLARPNASERPNPWGRSPVRYYVEFGTMRGDRGAVASQVDRAMGYYDAGAGGAIPRNVSFERTRSRSSAEVVVTFQETLPTGSDRGSYGTVSGYDNDTDPALERYARGRIHVSDIPPERVGWHVGYWMARQMGLERAEYPDPFDDPEGDPREDWWP